MITSLGRLLTAAVSSCCWVVVQESDLDRIISSNQPLTDQHFQYFLYQVYQLPPSVASWLSLCDARSPRACW